MASLKKPMKKKNLTRAKERWIKKIKDNYPTQPLFKEYFFDVAKLNILYWNIKENNLTERAPHNMFWMLNRNLIEKNVDQTI